MEPVTGGPPETLTADIVLVSIGRRPYTVSGRSDFQLPISSTPIAAPSLMSVRRDIPRQMTMLPGGGSLARAR